MAPGGTIAEVCGNICRRTWFLRAHRTFVALIMSTDPIMSKSKFSDAAVLAEVAKIRCVVCAEGGEPLIPLPLTDLVLQEGG